MPYVTRPRRGRLRGIAALAAAVGALAALPAVAAADCPTEPTSQVFAALGDDSPYSLLEGGSFESEPATWSLSGAWTIGENESFRVGGADDGRSLAIASWGRAVSPEFCVDITRPSFRFFARRLNGGSGALRVSLRWTDRYGYTRQSSVASVAPAGGGWTASAPLALASLLPLWQRDSTLDVRLVFDPDNYGASWAIDDVYIDPYSR